MIKFAELKQYISRTARISICFRNGNYDNYTMVSDIPDGKYDDMYVYGIGTADVEFPLDVYKRPSVDFAGDGLIGKGYYLGCGLEIVLQDEPRYSTRENEQLLSFCDLRSYLQLGMNFSVVKKKIGPTSNLYGEMRFLRSMTNFMYMVSVWRIFPRSSRKHNMQN